MQNNRAPQGGATTSLENKRPNILRRKAARQLDKQNPASLLTDTNAISTDHYPDKLNLKEGIPSQYSEKQIQARLVTVASTVDISLCLDENINVVQQNCENTHRSFNAGEDIQSISSNSLNNNKHNDPQNQTILLTIANTSGVKRNCGRLFTTASINEYHDEQFKANCVIGGNEPEVKQYVDNETEKAGTKRDRGKVFHRKRWPSNKIILDTYVCDKSRGNQLLTCEPAAPVTFSEDGDDKQELLFESDPQNEFLFDISQGELKAGEAGDDDGVPIPQDEVVLGALGEVEGLGGAAALAALQSAGLREELMVLVEGPPAQRLWLCPVAACNKLYSERPVLHAHILQHFDIATYTCNIDGCPKAYISQDQIDEHQLTHGQVEEIHQEDVAVDSLLGLEAEEEAGGEAAGRAGPRQLVMAALASVGVTEDQMFSVLLPDGGRVWLCPRSECELTFKTQSLLRNHILAHYDLRPFKCGHNGCGWAFRSVGKLRSHSAVHNTGPGAASQHACSHPGCRKTFSTKYNLAAHARLHERPQDRACPARGCTRSFPSRAGLEEHLAADHTPHHAAHKCGICNKRFWWTAGLAAHARAHSHAPGDLTCVWPGCGRRFPQPCRLRYHLRTHTGDKPYRCTYPMCNWAFPSASKLRRHARAHAGVKGRRHACPSCGRAFLRAEHLREHLPRHLPHRHHSCDHPGCEEKFSNKSSVYVHKKREHGADGGSKPPRVKRAAAKSRLPPHEPFILSVPQVQNCEEELLSLRSARTHVPWPCSLKKPPALGPHITDLLQHHTGCDEKQGNPLVCGGLALDGEGPGGGVGLCLEVGAGASGLPELGPDLLGPAADHINSLLLQEELSDGILYATEEESLQVLLLSEDPTQ